MSDKNEYWKELFGDDAPDGLMEELGLNAPSCPEEERGMDAPPCPEEQEWVQFDVNFRAEQDGGEDPMSDTHVIPDDVRRVSEVTGGPFGQKDKRTGAARDEEGTWEDMSYEEDEETGIRFERRKRTGLLGGLMYAVFLIGVSAILCCVLWLAASDVLALNKEPLTAEINVPADYTLSELAEDLKSEGLIEYKFLFVMFAQVFKAEGKIEPGTYALNTDYDYSALISHMAAGAGSQIEVEVMIPEGKTIAEIFQILEEKGVCSVAELEEAAANHNFNHAFLSGVPLGDAKRLEGYLFPDTYNFYKGTEASTVIGKLLNNFDTRMEENGGYEAVPQTGCTLEEIIIIASMIEREAASADEMPVIASVIYNRLNAGMALNIDATIQYILPERKENLTVADLAIESPYNTYLNEGLPPAPIACPGMTAILSALSPDSTEYYYYALHTEGYHAFFQDYDSHQDFVQSPQFAYYEG